MSKKRDYPLLDRMLAPAHATPGQLLIYNFCSQFRLEGKVDPDVMEQLAESLERVIFDGISADKALGLAKSRGGQPISIEELWRRIGIATSMLHQIRLQPLKTIPRIADDFVETYREKANFIQDQYEEYKEEAAAALRVLAANNPMEVLEEIAWFTERGYSTLILSSPLSPHK